jgi:hypothetical protein
MKTYYAAVLLILAAFLVGPTLIYGQEVHKMVVDIPNAFTASSAQLPAGRYEVTLNGVLHQTVNFRNLDGKKSATAMISTAIAADPAKENDGRLIFDVVGQQYILSEVWMPGHDGFLITGFKNDSAHKHAIAKGSVAK